MSGVTPDVVSIVDDDESVRLATVLLVASLGLDAVSFPSAEAFLASSALEQACCVIMDVNMPSMNGLELQAALSQRRPHLPVIFITAFPSEEIEQRARDGGAICFLIKPFKSDVLVNCIRAALDAGARSAGTE
jgi:FixJ family two-component response regulator